MVVARIKLILEHTWKINCALSADIALTKDNRKAEAVQQRGSLHFWLVFHWTVKTKLSISICLLSTKFGFNCKILATKRIKWIHIVDQTHTGQKRTRKEVEPEPSDHSVLSNFMLQFLYHPLCTSSHSNALHNRSYQLKVRLLKAHNSYSWGWGNGLRIILWLASPDLCDRSHIITMLWVPERVIIYHYVSIAEAPY